jgi:hypothetical protein
VYLVEAVAAWVLAAPWAETIASVIGAHPDGDRALFLRSGMPLLYDVQKRIGGAMLAGLVVSTLVGLAVYAVVSIFLRGALLAALGGARGRDAVGRAAGAFFRLLGVGAVSVFAIVSIFALVGVVPAYSIAARTEHWTPRSALALELVPFVVALALIAVVVAAADLARARVVAADRTAIDALSESVSDGRSVLSLVALSVPRRLASVGLLGVGAALSTKLSGVLAIFLVHQLIALARVGLQASVLARSLRFVPVRASGIET